MKILGLTAVRESIASWASSALRERFGRQLGEIAAFSKTIRLSLESQELTEDSKRLGEHLESLFDKRDKLVYDCKGYRPAMVWLHETATNRNEDFDMRYQAMACMAIIGDASSLRSLELCKQDPDEKIREQAEISIQKINDAVVHREKLRAVAKQQLGLS